MVAYKSSLEDLKAYVKRRDIELRDIIIPDDLYFPGELLWQEKPAREISNGFMHGATTRLPKYDLYKVISICQKMNFPKKTLEQKILSPARPKTVPKMVFPGLPGLQPWFENIPAEEAQTELEEKGKDGK